MNDRVQDGTVGEVISIREIRQARRRLERHVQLTPLLESALLNRAAGRRILVKAECLQHTGSFKFRGAWSALSAMDDAARARGVLAYSSGNHAQGVARAAELMAVPAVIVMPQDAPALKLANTRAYGAEVVTYDRAGGESREQIGAALADARGLTLVRPYDDPMVMAGQGTCGMELAGQARAAGFTRGDVLVCCGGGGLASGIALALEAEAGGLRVRPVEPVGFDDMTRSLAEGHRLSTDTPTTASICDAIVTPMPGELTFPVLQRLAGPGIVVSDDETLDAMAAAFLRLKLVVEPGGAAALAAALSARDDLGDTVVAVLTGGNVDPAIFARALARLDA